VKLLTYPHEHDEFADLLRIVSGERGVSEALIEKDYWVTHALWALSRTRLGVWFKGGTSLSKGFGLITRFSEDLDLKIDHGQVEDLPAVASWSSKNKGPIAAQRTFYEALATKLEVPGARVELVAESLGKDARGAEYRVLYPGMFLEQLIAPMRPFVLLEVGDARVVPFVDRTLGSWVHDTLGHRSLIGEFADNRPAAMRCVHPLVTLLDKLDAISGRFARGKGAPTFVRHYEDAARIIHAANANQLPALDISAKQLADDMLDAGDIRAVPSRTTRRSCWPPASAEARSNAPTPRSRPCSGESAWRLTMRLPQSAGGVAAPFDSGLGVTPERWHGEPPVVTAGLSERVAAPSPT
jgi:hypothetical protein